MRLGLTIIWAPPSNSIVRLFAPDSNLVGEGDRGEEPDRLRVGLAAVTISVICCESLLGELDKLDELLVEL